MTASGPLRVFTLLHEAKPALLNFSKPGGLDVIAGADPDPATRC
jgi:3-(3-hydroxy-phenyl)propionate hydroxylase